MRKARRILAAAAVAAALATVAPASASPSLYCGFNLDRVCRIVCPKCAAAPATAPRAANAGR